jgi:hypothetical protein
MKSRFAEWAKLTTTPAAVPQLAMVRVRDFPGVEQLERALLFGFRGRELPAELQGFVDAISKQLFDIMPDDTEYQPPEDSHLQPKIFIQADRDDHDLDYETVDMDPDQALEFLKRFGLDFSDSKGAPLLCIRFLKRPAEAAAKGMLGRMPDRAQVSLDSFQNKLEAEREAFLSRRKK